MAIGSSWVCTVIGAVAMADGEPPLAMPAVSSQPILPIPLTIELDPAKVALGERLFNDPRLSSNNALPCSACHQLAQGGDDGLPRSITSSGVPDVINAPTVFNSVFNFRHTWRGAFRTLEQQAEADLHNPRHANTNWNELLPKLKSDSGYLQSFYMLYPAGITRESVLDAIATFEKSLITPNSRFDQYLRGDTNALTEAELRGYQEFITHGCITCHQGVNVGGNLYQKVGVYLEYFSDRDITEADLGRFNVTGRDQDRFLFRVPSLRNVGVTAPYFHDGSIATLDEAIGLMGRIQLGIELNEDDVQDIEAFLHTLTGEYQGRSLAETGSTP